MGMLATQVMAPCMLVPLFLPINSSVSIPKFVSLFKTFSTNFSSDPGEF